MATEKQDSRTRLSPQRARSVEDGLVIERGGSFWLEGWGMSRAGADRAIRTLLQNGRKALLVAGPLPHPARAMMLAVSAAAGREIRLGVLGDERRNQCPTEEHHQRNCDGVAHS
jgi:hypothetical protein